MSWYYIDAWIKSTPTWGAGGTTWQEVDRWGPKMIAHGAANTIAETMATTRPDALVRKWLWQGGKWSRLQ